MGGSFGRQLKIAAMALGGSCSRRTCDDGIGISVIEAKGYMTLMSALARTAREDASMSMINPGGAKGVRQQSRAKLKIEKN